MPSVNIFMPEDYDLDTQRILRPMQHTNYREEWVFVCKIAGMKLQSKRIYTTEKGAWKAGWNWLEKNIHDKAI